MSPYRGTMNLAMHKIYDTLNFITVGGEGGEDDFSTVFPMHLRSLVNCRAWHLNGAMLIVEAPPSLSSPPPLEGQFLMQAEASLFNAAWRWVKGQTRPMKSEAITFSCRWSISVSPPEWRTGCADHMAGFSLHPWLASQGHLGKGQHLAQGTHSHFCPSTHLFLETYLPFPFGYPENPNSDIMSSCCLKSYVLLTFLENCIKMTSAPQPQTDNIKNPKESFHCEQPCFQEASNLAALYLSKCFFLPDVYLFNKSWCSAALEIAMFLN